MDPDTKPAHGNGGILQSKDHRDLLDIIDKLRSQGISRYVDLPQIIVCGDQSSGKSSVLEAISGMSFPTKDVLCTRFATELILRRSPTVGVKVHINPGPDRSKDDKKRLGAFEYTQSDLDIGQVVENAKDAMGLNASDKTFSTDILRVEISGPSQPHLTIVDLPGLFLAGDKDQTNEDSKLVESLVLSYMKKPRSIILAVVSAKNDFALQQVTRHTRALDPKGIRTLGLITKPDTLDKTSDSERFYVELAQNKNVKFRLGWHVLRNRTYAERDVPTVERDRIETEFFSEGVWTAIEASQLGVEALKLRLSDVLRDQILMQLPSVLEDVETEVKQCEHKLARLGASRATVSEQRRYLLKISMGYSSLLKAAIDGIYTDVFFTNVGLRLRAVVQNTLSDFAEQMRMEGHSRIIREGPGAFEDNNRCVSRSEYIEEVKVLMKESRGRELPGTYNPLIVAELFSRQCKPWQSLVYNLSERVLSSAYTSVKSVHQYVADEQTASSLFREVVGPSMKGLKVSLAAKIDEILEPHRSGHPITYNHYLTENVQKAQAARHRYELEKRLKVFFKKDELVVGSTNHWFDMRVLVETLVSSTEPDMDKFSCSIATDMMEAYYKVALKKVIDDVSILAIERCLIQRLPNLLSPDIICDLTDAEVQRIAGESNESAAQRMLTTEKLRVLDIGLADLKRLKRYNPSMLDSQKHPFGGTDPAAAYNEIVQEEYTGHRDMSSDSDAETNVYPDSPNIYALEVPPVPLEDSEPVPVDDLKWPGIPATKAGKKGRNKVTAFE